MRSSLLLTTILPLAALSIPTKRLPTLHSRQTNTSLDQNCDLSQISQPPNALSPPGSDLTLVLVALGQGTQNYTCASPSGTPSAIGAVATLFNASCSVSPSPSTDSGSSGSTIFGDPILDSAASIGSHFFVDNTTPEFDIEGLGNTLLRKVENVTAPNPAQDVPWLRLERKDVPGTTSKVEYIYRLNTVGGLAPGSCAGRAVGEVITVEYEAQYWIYSAA